jgi:hypothetical protein
MARVINECAGLTRAAKHFLGLKTPTIEQHFDAKTPRKTG